MNGADTDVVLFGQMGQIQIVKSGAAVFKQAGPMN
jgi:hypothetical protein